MSLAMSAWDLDTQGPGCHDLKPTHPALVVVVVVVVVVGDRTAGLAVHYFSSLGDYN